MREVHELYGAYDEADTRVAFHSLHVDVNDQGNTVIRCNDTDILIIMMSSIYLFENSSVWLDVGLDYNNSRHYVDIKATARNVGYVRALPGIYAFTGCDYTPAFLRKGNKQPIEIMIKNKVYADAFSKLGEEELDDETLATIEASCAMRHVWIHQPGEH